MDELIQAFKEGEQEGRSDTRQALNEIKAGSVPSDDYLFKIAKRAMVLGFIVGIGVFVYFLLQHSGFFISILFGFVAYFVSVIVLALSSVTILKLATKGKR